MEKERADILYEEYYEEKENSKLEEIEEDDDEENESVIGDIIFKITSISLFILIFVFIVIICKEIFLEDAIQIDKDGNPFLNVKTIMLKDFNEGKNEEIENFFTQNIVVNDSLSKEDVQYLDSLFSNKDIIKEEEFIELIREGMLFVHNKGIENVSSKYAFNNSCTLINPYEKVEVNYLYINITYDKNGTFFITDDEFIVTYVIL